MSSSELCVVCRSLKRMPASSSSFEQRRDAACRSPCGVVGVDELAAVGRQLERDSAASAAGICVQRLLQLQRQLLPAELAHQLGLVLDQDDLALADDADAVGHLLGLVDVVRGQDDRHAARRAARAPAATCRAAARRRRRPSARRGTGLCGSCDSAFAISSRRFMPPDSVMILLSFLSHSDRSFSTFSMCAGLGGLPNRPRLNDTVAQTRLERVGRELLRHEADHRARGAIVRDDVVAVDEDRALASG